MSDIGDVFGPDDTKERMGKLRDDAAGADAQRAANARGGGGGRQGALSEITGRNLKGDARKMVRKGIKRVFTGR